MCVPYLISVLDEDESLDTVWDTVRADVVALSLVADDDFFARTTRCHHSDHEEIGASKASVDLESGWSTREELVQTGSLGCHLQNG